MFDEKIIKIAKTIHENNGSLYLVGGAIRDELLNIPTHDLDFCVTGISFEKFTKLFSNAKIIGKDFPVFMINSCEFALARKERKISTGHTGFEIYSDDTISIEEDLRRRDITINAIAKDVLTGKLIDPFGGIQDLQNHVIKHVSNAFAEDPLRVYRVARFSANYNFFIDNNTLKLMKNLKNELYSLSAERVFIELRKALNTPTPSIFFNVLKSIDVLDVHFKEINDLIFVQQPKNYHPEGDVYNHTMIVLDKVSKITKDETVRFCALTHDFGKARTPKDILPRHINHEISGLDVIRSFCNRLKVPTIWKKKSLAVCKYHMKAGICSNMRPYTLAKFINEVNRSAIGLHDLNIISNADDMLNRKKLQFSTVGADMQANVNGNTLKKEGITVKSVGVKKYNEILLQKQAEYITKRHKLK